MKKFLSLRAPKPLSLRASAHTGVAIPRIFQPALALALTLALLLTLTGCHGTLVPPTAQVEAKDPSTLYAIPEEFDTSRDYEITFWAKNDTNSTQVAIYKQAIADFQDCYPNITVNLRLYTDYGRIYNDVITNIATNTTPNVCVTYPDHIATYLTGEGTVVPLDGLMADGRYGLAGTELAFDGPAGEELIPKFLEECRFGGYTYALPFLRSTEACYVNKTYVEALGYQVPEVLTWDFVWQVSEAAMEKDDSGNFRVNGQKVLIPFLYKSTDNMMIQMLRQLGADYTTDRGEVRLFHDTTGELLTTIAAHSRSGAFNTFKLVGYPANFLNAGQCIFAVDSTAGATWMGSDAPLVDIPEEKLVKFETVVRPVPQFDPENPTMISQGPSLCVFNKEDPQEVLASWLFAQFLLTNDVQIAYAQTEGYVPVTAKAQESGEYQDYLARAGEDNDLHYSIKMDATRLLLENTDNTFVTPVFNGSASVRNAAGQLIEETVKSVRRKKTVDDAYLQALYPEMTALYRLDQIHAAETSETEASNLEAPLPVASRVLLGTLAACWVGMGVYVAWKNEKKKGKYH